MIMQCPTPESIPRPNGKGATDRISIPCGACAFCLENKRSEWTFRLREEQKASYSAYFLTLTYSDEYLPLNEYGYDSLSKDDLKRFNKRLKDHQRRLIPKYHLEEKYAKWPPIRFYAIGEYGPTTMRPHYHGIYFNIIPEIITKIDTIWQQGHLKIGTTTPASIHYVTGYLIQPGQDYTYLTKPFALMSRNPGIGSAYMDKEKIKYHQKTKNFYGIQDGYRVNLPRFYRDKLFNKTEKEAQANKNRALSDKKEHKTFERLAKLGNNPFTRRDLEIEEKNRKVNKSLKTKKL